MKLVRPSLLLLPSLLFVCARMEPQLAKGAFRHLHRRQQTTVAGGGNAPVTTPADPLTSTGGKGDSGGILGGLTSLIDGGGAKTTATTPVTVPQQQTTVIVTPTSAVDTPSRSSAIVSKPTTTGPTVVQVTQTSTISYSTSSVPSASATSAPDTSNNSSSGLSKGTVIAIVIVASAVGGIAAIWTIIRKWKLSPSRRFEDKLNPIDFVDNYGVHHGAQTSTTGLAGAGAVGSGLSRSGSNASSEGMLHKREGSWGSANGSQRGAGGTNMSEAGGYGRPIYPPQPQGQQAWVPASQTGGYQQPNPYDYNAHHDAYAADHYAPPSQQQHDPYAGQYRY